MKHTRIRTTIPRQDDTGLSDVEVESYHEQLVGVTQEVEQKIWATDTTLLADVIKCLGVLTSGETRELTLKLKVDNGRINIMKCWTVNKAKYGQRSNRQ